MTLKIISVSFVVSNKVILLIRKDQIGMYLVYFSNRKHLYIALS